MKVATKPGGEWVAEIYDVENNYFPSNLQTLQVLSFYAIIINVMYTVWEDNEEKLNIQ